MYLFGVSIRRTLKGNPPKAISCQYFVSDAQIDPQYPAFVHLSTNLYTQDFEECFAGLLVMVVYCLSTGIQLE
jgi:hypothetical protein